MNAPASSAPSATSTSNAVEMLHASSAAAPALGESDRASTTVFPASWRTANTAIPARITQPPTFRTALRRSGLRNTAPANETRTNTSRIQTRVLNRSRASCAPSSWSGLAICSFARSGGSLSTTSGGRPVPSATWRSRSLRSSVTSRFPASPSTTASSALCAARLAAEQPRRVAVGDLLQPRSCGAREAVQRRRQRLLQARLDVFALIQPVDEVGPERVPDRLVLEQVIARLHPVVRVEHLPIRPQAEAEHDQEERAQHEQGDDRDASGRAHGTRFPQSHPTFLPDASPSSVMQPCCSSSAASDSSPTPCCAGGWPTSAGTARRPSRPMRSTPC